MSDVYHGPRRRRFTLEGLPDYTRFGRRMERTAMYNDTARLEARGPNRRTFTDVPMLNAINFNNAVHAAGFGAWEQETVGDVTYLGRRQGSSYGGDHELDTREHFALARMRNQQARRVLAGQRMSVRRLAQRHGLPSDVIDFLG